MRNDFESNYLAHWGISKGGKAANHKYFERIEKNGRYIYFYTQAEYERWLHGAKKAVDTVKGKAKGAAQKLSSIKKTPKKVDTRRALSTGSQMAPQLVARSKTALTKSNAQSIIDRGNKAISSVINRSKSVASTASKMAKNTASKVSSQTKDVSTKAMKVAKNLTKQIQSNAKSTVTKAQKSVENYAAKGQKAISKVMDKAKSISVSDAIKKFSAAGTQILAPVLVAANNIKNRAVNKITDVATRKQRIEEGRREGELRKKEIEARNEARRKERERTSTKQKDAQDSYFEDLAVHTDIRQKKEEMSKDEDMKAVNKMTNIPDEEFKKKDEYYSEYIKLMREYNKTGDLATFGAAREMYDKYSDIYNKYYGYLNNCSNCTLTYDLRRRGYDVDAPWNDQGTNYNTTFGWYKMTDSDIDTWDSDAGDYKAFSKSEAKEIVNDIKGKYPEGSYGHFMVQWQGEGNGGHDCVWSIENDKVIIRDCQTGKIVQPEKYLTQAYSVSYFRADDKELSDTAYELAKADITNKRGEDKTTDEEYVSNKRTIQISGKNKEAKGKGKNR